MDINKVIAIVRRLNESPSIIKARGKRNTYMGPTGDHSRDKEGNIKASFYKKKPAPQGEKGGKRIGRKNKSARYGSQLHRLRPASERMKEELSPMQDNNLFGNAYAGSAPPKKKKNKKLKESSFQDYMAQAQAARDRQAQKIKDRKEKDAQFVDTKKHGVRFYDKKGKGRIRSGKKIYDK